MEIIFHAHSCFSIITDTHHLLIDPFITGNPLAKIEAASLKPDVILLTHGHNDHVGDALSLAKQQNALIIAPVELADYCQRCGVKRTHPLQIGGSYSFDFGKIKLTPTLHSSAFTDDRGQTIYTGNPCGILFYLANKIIYHAGDTGLSQEMMLIGDSNHIDLALLPIGDNYTMGPEDALEAIAYLNPEITIPIHYNTFPVIQQNPAIFVEQVVGGKVLNPGETILV